MKRTTAPASAATNSWAAAPATERRGEKLFAELQPNDWRRRKKD